MFNFLGKCSLGALTFPICGLGSLVRTCTASDTSRKSGSVSRKLSRVHSTSHSTG